MGELIAITLLDEPVHHHRNVMVCLSGAIQPEACGMRGQSAG
jgi:hypothetical protein